jgi:hypothetical protein
VKHGHRITNAKADSLVKRRASGNYSLILALCGLALLGGCQAANKGHLVYVPATAPSQSIDSKTKVSPQNNAGQTPTDGPFNDAGTPTSSQSSEGSCLYITNGLSQDPSNFPSVVLISVATSATSTSFCTGTFIGDNVVLTVAHCLDELQTNGGTPPSEITIHVGGSDGQDITASKAFYMMWAGEDNSAYGNDLAVLVVPEGSAPSITPVAVVPPAINGTVTIAGFGNLQVGHDNNNSNSAHDLYSGSNQVAGLIDDYIFEVGEAGTKITSESGQNSLAASGDSGGPMFFNNTLVGTEAWGTEILPADAFTADKVGGEVSPSPTHATFQHDFGASVYKLPNLAQIQQQLDNGAELGIDTHINVTLPKYQQWVRSLTSQGIHIQFATDAASGCGG